MTHTRTTTALATAALLAALALAACSSDGGGDDEPEPQPTQDATEPTGQPTNDGAAGGAGEGDQDEAALEQAVRDYTDAFFAPDADTAYAMLSARCQGQIDETTYGAQLDQAAADYGQLSVETFTVNQLSGDLARVTYTVGLPLFDDQLTEQPWTREADTWRYDAC